jgi:hypothetical protein
MTASKAIAGEPSRIYMLANVNPKFVKKKIQKNKLPLPVYISPPNV